MKKYNLVKWLKYVGITGGISAILLSGCGDKDVNTEVSTSIKDDVEITSQVSTSTETIEEVVKLNLENGYKTRGNTNPIMTQSFGADPFALVYNDEIYIYMTQDAFEYDASGNMVKNTYGKIKTIHCVSTKDMKNFTDHGEITVAGKDGHATWAHNSWAPAAAYKNIDGEDKFFLYFADNGGGIGVLTADSPTGPFTDPLGHALISRSTPNCANVLWLFDPAVFVDDDGTGYIYFGGGVPQDKISAPGTGRVAKLGADMISIEGDPVTLDVPYLFEDSGIHKYKDKYYYTYCTNWNVSEEGTAQYGFASGEIACLVSDSPMGPFTYQGRILRNPGTLCGLYGNNHHAVFEYESNWYIVYHTRMLEQNMGIELDYRATSIDKVTINEDGTIENIKLTKEGPDQLRYVDPYSVNSAVCVSKMTGTNAVPSSDACSYGDMILGEIETGDYIEITGVDFGEKNPTKINVNVRIPEGTSGKILVRKNFVNSDDVCVINVTGNGSVTLSGDVTGDLTGVNYLYFVFACDGIEMESWKCE